MINFGAYDQKCEFINFQNLTDGYGGSIPTESISLATKCRSIQISGGFGFESLQLTLPDTYRIGVLIRSGFQPSTAMQIKYKGEVHKITGVSITSERNAKEWIITMIRS